MAQQPIEVILARELASCLAHPAFLVDPDGNLLYYNEGAEGVLGFRFDETGPMPMAEWSTAFSPMDEAGQPIPTEKLPLVIALSEWRPAHLRFWIRGLDGVSRQIEVTAMPLVGQGNRRLGGLAIFWEIPAP